MIGRELDRRNVSCYFLLNFVVLRGMLLGCWSLSLTLLFSFEFCKPEEKSKPEEKPPRDLLFSFEFCPVLLQQLLERGDVWVEPCYFLLNFVRLLPGQLRLRTRERLSCCCCLAIFFWILLLSYVGEPTTAVPWDLLFSFEFCIPVRVTDHGSSRVCTPCYFLLNFVCVVCPYRQVSLGESQLAIFFWILLSRCRLWWASGASCRSACYFLLNFVFEARLRNLAEKIREACYFLLNFVADYLWDRIPDKYNLLFSFEFCLLKKHPRLEKELRENLLFSFEFCGKLNLYVPSPTMTTRTCYFLLNFVQPHTVTETQTVTQTPCYFLLNFVCWIFLRRFAAVIVSTLAIFFWILWRRSRLENWQSNRIRNLAIFFWILSTTRGHLQLQTTVPSILLFSFEFCILSIMLWSKE